MSTVLLICQDGAQSGAARQALLNMGHDVLVASSGIEGIRAATRQHPNLIIVDYELSDLDGYELTIRLRDMPWLEHVPILAVTSIGDREASLAVGADGSLPKPLDVDTLPEIATRFLSLPRRGPEVTAVPEHLRERTRQTVRKLETKLLELSETNAKLQDAFRLRREFLRNLSHELATPMTPVVGYLRLLLNEELGPLTPLQKKCLVSVEESTRRLRSLVETMLDVSGLETGRMHFYERSYDFGDVVETAIDEIRPRCEQLGRELLCEPIKGPLPARGDPEKLRRAMAHVLDNAIKFTPQGGAIGVGVRRGRSDDGDWLGLVVADSGVGIPTEQLENVFHPFYQVDGSVTREFGGVGLGLAFVKRVSEAMGGSVEVASPPMEDVSGRRFAGTSVLVRVLSDPPPFSRHDIPVVRPEK